ncbi:MAG: PadR family transcriptional regulator [Spirochaetia bacterium]|jgi:DNA-binding PadR family transcriptional regulator
MSLKHGILGLLSYGPMGGYDTLKYFNGSLGNFWTAQPSQFYRELEKLAEAGFIKDAGKLQRGHVTKTVYEITDAGRQELARWLAERPEELSGVLKNGFLIKLFFQAMLGKDVLREMLEVIKSHSHAKAEELRSTVRETAQRYAASVSPLDAFCWLSTLEYGIAHFEMESRWAAARLAELGDIPDVKRKEGELA